MLSGSHSQLNCIPIHRPAVGTLPEVSFRIAHAPNGQISRPGGTRLGTESLERLAPGEARIRLVPPVDAWLIGKPAQVDLLAVPDRGKVDEAAVSVAQHDVHCLQLRGGPEDLEDGARDR